jgi:hypothetical protein
MNYETMKTVELRKLVRERKIAKGEKVVYAGKHELINMLTNDDLIRGGAQEVQQDIVIPRAEDILSPMEAPRKDDALADVLAEALKGKINAGIDEDVVIELIEKYALRTESAEKMLEDTQAKMETMIHERMKKMDLPTVVTIKKEGEQEQKDMGIQHRCFPTMLKVAQARDKDGFVPVMYLHGPAGTGKTTSARMLAEALDLPFHFNGAIDSEYKLSGFVDASGTFQSRPFYKAYAEGGVYLFDELDSSMPSAVLAFNASLANGHADFPVGTVQRHKNCIIIGAGNTTLRGDGYNEGFQRNEMDGAFRDRFNCYIEFPIDNALEASCTPNDFKYWLDIVRCARRSVKQHGIKKHEVSPRATFSGIALLQQGIPIEQVIDMTLRKGLPDESWSKVNSDIKEVF